MILFFFIISSLAFAGDEIFQFQWHQLLHRDIQKDPKFWLAGAKAHDEDELQATIKAFKTKLNWDTNDHPQCLYPARRTLIEKYYGKKLFPRSKCPDYDEWIERLNPQSVSVVFAGNYPDNPGSLFGHTFLKFSGPDSRGNNLLDYALNYSAEVSDDIGVLYAIKGLVGGYYGGFTLDPYYLKVNEYNEGEGRDLWEYKTALTPEEATFILAHVWELKNRAEFKYYFLSDNCSLFILKLLDLARPNWKLENKMPWYVIPLETVKVMNQDKSILNEITYRPSVRLRAQSAFSQLKLHEQRKVKKILREESDILKEKDSKVLKASAMQLAAIHSRKDGYLPPDLAQKEETILLRLSELPQSHQFEHQALPSPHNGHDIAQLALGTISDSRTDLLFGYRLGVHDLNDYVVGYLPYSELSILDAQLRANDKNVSFQKIDFLSMLLLRPWNLNEREWSWSAKASYEGHSNIFAEDKRKVAVEAQAGVASLSHKSLLLSWLAGIYYRGGVLDLKQSTGPMSQIFIIMNSEKWKNVNGIRFYQDINHTQESAYQIAPYSNFAIHSTPNWDYQLEFNWPLYIHGLNRNPSLIMLKVEHHF